MNSVSDFLGYLFALAALLIAAAYFSGFVADTNAVGTATNSLLQTATGRNAQGQFAGYPAGTTAKGS